MGYKISLLSQHQTSHSKWYVRMCEANLGTLSNHSIHIYKHKQKPYACNLKEDPLKNGPDVLKVRSIMQDLGGSK